MGALVGSTGFVGGHLLRSHGFEHQVHRSDIMAIAGLSTDLLVCAGLPAEKWRANRDPAADWANMTRLAKVLASVEAERAVLISTIDVYQPAVGVDETRAPDFDGAGAYGTHRAWFETFFQARFPESLVLRLPGLFAPDVRKNLVHDLMHGRADQWSEVNPASTFQFFDARMTWTMIERAWDHGIRLLNVATEPVTAQEIADLFGQRLHGRAAPVTYDMRSIHSDELGGSSGYLSTRTSVLAGIAELAEGSPG